MNAPTRHPIRCPDCRSIVTIRRIITGTAAVQPVSWFVASFEHWEAACDCRVRVGDTQGDLYRALGYGYA